jgi:hypothetical protein
MFVIILSCYTLHFSLLANPANGNIYDNRYTWNNGMLECKTTPIAGGHQSARGGLKPLLTGLG